MATAITKRANKGSALTITEMDTNLQNLADAVDSKQAALVSGTNIKTINGSSILGPGDVTVTGGASATLSIVNTAVAYTITAADLGKIINCTSGTFTVSLTAAATLGSGFTCTIWNTSNTATDVITIDPNLTEKIDNQTTIVLYRGEGLSIICDETNWQIDNKKPMRVYTENMTNAVVRPFASGQNSVAIGEGAGSSGSYATALGYYARCSGTQAIALGMWASAGGGFSTAIGANSGGNGSITVSSTGSTAVGGSYASGIDSFAAAIANNTSSYGAKGDNSVAIGSQCLASGAFSIAMGRLAAASGTYSVAFGYDKTLSGNYSFSAGGYSHVINQNYGIAIGGVGTTVAVVGKVAIGTASTSGWLSQLGILISQKQTTNATPALLTSDGSTANTTNQVILPNNSVYGFTGTVTAMQQVAGGTDFAIWEIKGGIRRGATAAATALGTYNINVLSKSSGATAWAIALTADTTNGGLAITATGAAATNIRWVATVNTSEVTYA
jgi:hypothetical protein